MKIKTYDELQDKIDSELSWRRRDITQIRFNIQDSKANTPASEFAIRSGFILLYADWEGFIRTISNYYVIYVFSKNLQLKKLSLGFWTIFNFTEFDQLGNSKKKSSQMKLIKKIIDNSEKITKKNIMMYWIKDSLIRIQI